MDRNKIIVTLFAIGLYFISAGASYLFFSGKVTQGAVITPIAAPTTGANGSLAFDQSLPKTQACPINGELYSKQQEAWWQKHRPLGVMIENQVEARPQSGLTSADTVYEAVAEGGITRFLAVFYCQDAGIVGPVRSARTYFIDFISEYGTSPLYAHVGGANQPGPADALGQLTDYGWTNYNDLNQFSFVDLTFYRDYSRLKLPNGQDVATEHTMYSTTTGLWDYAAKYRKLTNVDPNGTSWDSTFVPYQFTNDAPLSQRPASQTIHLEFWPSMGSDYFVDWVYDPKTNLYKRFEAGNPQTDKDNGKQIESKDIIVLNMDEQNAEDGYVANDHLLYSDKGSGTAVVFKDGKRINATWTKQSRTSRTILTDASGNQIKFDRGQMWFEILPPEGILTVK